MFPIKTMFARFVVATVLVPLLAGCTTFFSTPGVPWQIDDPPHLSPNNQSLNYFPTREETDETKTEVPTKQRKAGPPHPLPKIDRETDETPADRGPRFVPRQQAASASLKLTVQTAPRKQIGSGATFQVTVRNVGDRDAEDVVVEADFDEALVFPGRREKRIRQSLGRIAAGDSRNVAVMLVSDKQGSHCARFTLTARGQEAAWKSVCVEFVARKLDVRLIGPTERTLGSRAEFTIKLVNTAAYVLKDVRAVVSQDAVLEPREGSTGAVFEEGCLSWNLGELKPGEGVQIQVEYACNGVQEQARVRLTTSGANVPEERVEHFLRVRERQGFLDLHVRDMRDPIGLGEETTFELTLRNSSPQIVHGVRVVAEVPENLRIVTAEVTQADRVMKIAANVDGRQVSFGPVATLQPGATLSYRVEVKALRAGDGQFTARVKHLLSRAAVSITEWTTVNP